MKTPLIVPNLTKVKSSNIQNIAYDEEKKLLYVTFSSGVYSYKAPKEEFEAMSKAESVGKYMNTIKNKYEFQKLDVELKSPPQLNLEEHTVDEKQLDADVASGKIKPLNIEGLKDAAQVIRDLTNIQPSDKFFDDIEKTEE